MSFTTAIAQLPDGNAICYMDSGPLQGPESYTTIVLLHGTSFNSNIFERLHPLAAQHGLRLIAVHRKDYKGSSPYTDTELDELKQAKVAFIEHWAILLGHLIHYLIRTLNLPAPNAERSGGGVVLLGWSAGCATASTLLFDSSIYHREEYDILHRYTRKIVFYDPPFAAFGFSSITGAGTSYPKLANTSDEHFKRFRRYVSCYFDHPSPEKWDGDPKNLDFTGSSESATVDSWTEEDWENIFEGEAADRSEWPLLTDQGQSALRDLAQRALFDETNAKKTFPDISLVYIACWRTVPNSMWGYKCMSGFHLGRGERKLVRPMKFEVVRDANHFWHWDAPQEFLKTVSMLVIN